MKNQNETPFGSPRFLAALAITFLSLWGWQYYLNKKYPPQTATKAATTSAPATQAVGADATGASSDTTAATANTAAMASGVETKTLSYADEKVSFSVSSVGMGFSAYEIKDYKDNKGQNIQFTNAKPLFGLYHNGQPVLFSLSQKSATEFVGEATLDGKKIVRTLTYDPKTHAIRSAVQFDAGLEKLDFQAQQNKLIITSTNFLMPSFEHQDFIFVQEGKTHAETISGIKEGEGFIKTSAGVSMASISSQYFTAAIVNKSDFLPSLNKKVEGHNANIFFEYDLKNIKANTIDNIVYIGAKKTEILAGIDPLFEEVMNYGMFGFISKPLLKLLKFMYDLLGNWGFAIIGMTIIVRAILLPFNVISFRSAQAMQRIKPQMDAVREKYKNDPMRLNKETMALMKDNNANPVSGCLPMLIQIPIFFALWRAISGSVELYQQPFFGWIHDLSQHDPYFVLPILMGLTMYLQQKMTPTTMDPTQQKILNFMPIMFTLFMVTLPSGLTLYNFVSALFGVTQQFFLLKSNKSNTAALKPA